MSGEAEAAEPHQDEVMRLILERLDSIEQRMAQGQARLDGLEGRICRTEERLTVLEEKVYISLLEEKSAWERVMADFSDTNNQVKEMASDVKEIRRGQNKINESLKLLKLREDAKRN